MEVCPRGGAVVDRQDAEGGGLDEVWELELEAAGQRDCLHAAREDAAHRVEVAAEVERRLARRGAGGGVEDTGGGKHGAGVVRECNEGVRRECCEGLGEGCAEVAEEIERTVEGRVEGWVKGCEGGAGGGQGFEARLGGGVGVEDVSRAKDVVVARDDDPVCFWAEGFPGGGGGGVVDTPLEGGLFAAVAEKVLEDARGVRLGVDEVACDGEDVCDACKAGEDFCEEGLHVFGGDWGGEGAYVEVCDVEDD